MIKLRCLDITADVGDPVAVWQRFLEAVNGVPGITILATVKHDFPGGGLTGIIVVGESHVALHTWPERRYAWAELATCGDPDSLDEFERQIRRYFGDVAAIPADRLVMLPP